MLRLSTFCMLLALAVAQNGYEYNKPNRPFGSSSSRPGTSGTSFGSTTSFPLRPQNDDYNGSDGPTTNYPTGPQGYPGSSSQRPSYSGSSYPGQGPSGGYPGQSDSSYPGSRGPSSNFPNGGSTYPGQGRNYPGQPGSNFGPGFGDSDTGNYEGGDYSAIPGEADIDYPVLSYIPQTSFDCSSQPYPGYYADVETRCQVFHVCSNNNTYDFLCPNGTIFSQEVFVCVWWNQFSCESAPSLFELNAKLYDYSITGSSGDLNDFQSSYLGNRGPQGPSYSGSGTQRPLSYPDQGPQGPSTTYPGGPGSSYPGSQSPSGSYPGSQSSSGSYPGSQGSSNGYPGPQGPSNDYPGSQGTFGNYPGTQGTSDSYPGYQGGSGSYPSGPQGSPGSPGSLGSGPGSSYTSSGPASSYPGSGPGSQGFTTRRPSGSGSSSQGYPSGRPSGPSFQPGGNRGRPAQKPNREYLPPRN